MILSECMDHQDSYILHKLLQLCQNERHCPYQICTPIEYQIHRFLDCSIVQLEGQKPHTQQYPQHNLVGEREQIAYPL